jgi:hypothetical protein
MGSTHDFISPHPEAQVFRTRTAEIWIGDDGIVRVVSRPGAVHEVQDARENLAAIPGDELRPRPVLVDIRRIGGLRRGAREVYSSSRENPDSNAIALLVSSTLSKAIGNFFIGLRAVQIPTRLFVDYARALDWLSGFLER